MLNGIKADSTICPTFYMEFLAKVLENLLPSDPIHVP